MDHYILGLRERLRLWCEVLYNCYSPFIFMTICERLFAEIPGSEKVFDLLISELDVLKFYSPPSVSWLFVRGSENLVLTGTLPLPDLKYGATWRVPYQFPHLIVAAETGVIKGVRLDDNSKIIDSDRERSLIHLRPHVAELPCDKITHRRRWYEAILEVRYT